MKNGKFSSTLAVVVWAAVACSSAQAAEVAIGHTPQLVIASLPSRDSARLQVSSPAFPAGGDIPIESTQYGANRFPGLAWTRGPEGTRSYVVVIQGAMGGQGGGATGTSIQFTAVNIAATTTSLPAGITALPAGAVYGPNVHGPHGAYAGPHAHTTQRQDYHLQVLALDTVLPAGGDRSFDALLAVIKGHVLASGEVVGISARPAESAAIQPVRIDTGLVQGVPGRDLSTTVYRGIPYAAAPIGALRWRAPAPSPAWEGVRKAEAFGPVCPQPTEEMVPKGMSMDEDCLSLNVWTGAKSASEKRPVYVWIYGGGFIGGAGSSPDFDGEGLARKGVIVVTFNYRVGALGFLATPALSRESGHNASGDYGLLDDIAALRWVQRNIAAFGGDPTRVTIGGQSAGAGSVGFLSMSPLAKGLFRASIAESHARYPRDPELRYLSVSYRRMKEAEAEGEAYAKAHGAATLAALRAQPWQEVIKGSNAIDPHVQTGSDGEPPLFRPVVDGWVIPETYSQTYASGAQNNVVFVAGNNRDETGAVPETAFAALRASTSRPRAGMPQTNVTLALFVKSARRKFGAMADEFLKLYPAADDQEAALQNNAAARDDSRSSTYLWGTLWTRAATKPVYTYFWTHAPPGPSHDMRGAYHGSEINYAFDNLYATSRPWTDDDHKIADLMSSYWSNIIKTGDPNGAGLPIWPKYDPRTPQVMELGDHFGPIPVASPAKLDFWKRFYLTQDAW